MSFLLPFQLLERVFGDQRTTGDTNQTLQANLPLLILGGTALGVAGLAAYAISHKKVVTETYENQPSPTRWERIGKGLKHKEIKKVVKLASGLGALGLVAALSSLLSTEAAKEEFGEWFQRQDFGEAPVIVPPTVATPTREWVETQPTRPIPQELRERLPRIRIGTEVWEVR